MRVRGCALLVCLCACLSPPGDPERGDGSEGDRDATPEPDAPRSDAALPSCADRVDFAVGFEDEIELSDWTKIEEQGCSMTVNGVIQFNNNGMPGMCRRWLDAGLYLVDRTLTVHVADPGIEPALDFGFSLALNSGQEMFNDRRFVSFERDNGLLLFGWCENSSCNDSAYGSVAYDPTAHAYLRFEHDAAAGVLRLKTSSNGSTYNDAAAPLDVTSDLVACVGVELGSYEEQVGDGGSFAFDDLVAD